MTARVCQMFLTKGGTLNKNGTPKSVCSFATSCPNFGKSSCGLLDMEDLFLSTNVTSEKKKVANLFSSRQNLLKQQQQQESNTEKVTSGAEVKEQNIAKDSEPSTKSDAGDTKGSSEEE